MRLIQIKLAIIFLFLFTCSFAQSGKTERTSLPFKNTKQAGYGGKIGIKYTFRRTPCCIEAAVQCDYSRSSFDYYYYKGKKYYPKDLGLQKFDFNPNRIDVSAKLMRKGKPPKYLKKLTFTGITDRTFASQVSINDILLPAEKKHPVSFLNNFFLKDFKIVSYGYQSDYKIEQLIEKKLKSGSTGSNSNNNQGGNSNGNNRNNHSNNSSTTGNKNGKTSCKASLTMKESYNYCKKFRYYAKPHPGAFAGGGSNGPRHVGVKKFTLYYKKTTTIYWEEKQINARGLVMDREGKLYNLEPCTKYDYKVKIECEDGSSVTTLPKTFTTKCSPGRYIHSYEGYRNGYAILRSRSNGDQCSYNKTETLIVNVYTKNGSYNETISFKPGEKVKIPISVNSTYYYRTKVKFANGKVSKYSKKKGFFQVTRATSAAKVNKNTKNKNTANSNNNNNSSTGSKNQRVSNSNSSNSSNSSSTSTSTSTSTTSQKNKNARTSSSTSTSSTSSSSSSPSYSSGSGSELETTTIAVVVIAAAAVGTYVAHYYWGKMLYTGEPLPEGSEYSEPGPLFSVSGGQSLTFISTPNNEQLNGLNFDVKLEYSPIYTPFFATTVNANGVAGTGLLFGNVHAGFSLGAKVMGGIPNVKVFGEYEQGARATARIYYSSPMSYGFQRYTGGLRFSFGENNHTHIELGAMLEIQDDRTQYLNDNYFIDKADLGGMLSVSVDNAGEFFVQGFPRYYTNLTQEERGENSPMTYFVNIGYRRRWDYFHKGSERTTKEFKHLQNKKFIFGIGPTTRYRLSTLREQENVFSVSPGRSISLLYMEGDIRLNKYVRTQVGLGLMHAGSNTGRVVVRDVAEDQTLFSYTDTYYSGSIFDPNNGTEYTENYTIGKGKGDSFSMSHHSIADIPISASVGLPLKNKTIWARVGTGIKIGLNTVTSLGSIGTLADLEDDYEYTGISTNIHYNFVGFGIDVPTKRHGYRASLSYEWETNSVLDSFATQSSGWNLSYFWIF
ncbi:MAG: hypothetical protein GY827_10390 [Cytophagales bacterium]|nr:hypothetical protein [Cytophagales bacterium]